MTFTVNHGINHGTNHDTIMSLLPHAIGNPLARERNTGKTRLTLGVVADLWPLWLFRILSTFWVCALLSLFHPPALPSLRVVFFVATTDF